MSATIRIPDYLTSYTGKTPYLPSLPWVIETLIVLEREANLPVISNLAVSTSPRRAVVYAALAALRTDVTARTSVAEFTAPELVDWLLRGDLKQIVTTCFGEDSAGLFGVVEKAYEPLNDPTDYAWLAEVLRCRTERTRRQALCLRHARHVTSDLIRTLQCLRNTLLRPAIVSGIGSPDRAAHIEALVDHIARVAPKVPPHVISQSLETGGLGDLFRWASRMVLRHGVGLNAGLADCDDFRVWQSADDFQRGAARFQCCLADESQGHALAASFGVSAVIEAKHHKVLAVLTLMSDGGRAPVWVVLDRLWGLANSRVPETVEIAIAKALRARGILTLANTAPADEVNKKLIDAYCDRQEYMMVHFRRMDDLPSPDDKYPCAHE